MWLNLSRLLRDVVPKLHQGDVCSKERVLLLWQGDFVVLRQKKGGDEWVRTQKAIEFIHT